MRNLAQRTEAVISLSALKHNIDQIRSRIMPGVQIIAVLKGDAYGHGIEGVYETLKSCGVEHYATAVWEEGAALRRACCTEPILLLGDTHDSRWEDVVANNLTPTIFSLDTAKKLSDIAAAHSVIQPIHIKIDTGMNRIGLPATDESIDIIKQISELPNIEITGAFTHFSRADEPDGIVVREQMDKFNRVLDALASAGVEIPLKHASNSPATILHPEVQLDAVRVGDIIFGLCPMDEDAWRSEGFRQVMSWYTYVAMVKEVPAGSEIGYGGAFKTARPTKIATIPVGFADGYSRKFSNTGFVTINGEKAPIIGRVCMDQFMVDVTDIGPVHRGDTVTLMDDELDIIWMANTIGCSMDEVVCGITKRVPRVYED